MEIASVTLDLRGRLAYLSPAQRRLAELIIANPGRVIGQPIKELAADAATSQSSVVRLCHELGLAGYPELKLALASETAVARHATGEPEGDISEGDDLASVIRKVAASDVSAVRDTARSLSADSLEAVIDALVAANRIDIYGVGASGIVASDLHQKLTRIGRISQCFSDAHLALTSAVLLDSCDAALAISHSGATRDTFDALSLASERGARTITITNSPGSPLALLADHVLYTAAQETVFRSGATASRLAQLMVIDCVFVGLAQRTFTASQAALQATRAVVQDRRLGPHN